MNSLTMMALPWVAFVLVNVMVVGAQADSATGENKQGVMFVVSTFWGFSLISAVVDSRAVQSQDLSGVVESFGEVSEFFWWVFFDSCGSELALAVAGGGRFGPGRGPASLGLPPSNTVCIYHHRHEI